MPQTVIGSQEGSAKETHQEHLLEWIGEQLIDVSVRKPSMMSRCFHMRAALSGLKRILFEVIRKEQFVQVLQAKCRLENDSAV